MASSLPVPDSLGHMTSLLLNDFFRALEPGGGSPDKLRLEYFLVQAGAPRDLEYAVFLQRIDDSSLPLLKWYLEFTNGRDRGWLQQLNPGNFMRIWAGISDSLTRGTALRSAVLVEHVQGVSYHDSAVLTALRESELYDEHSDVLTAGGTIVANELIGMYASAASRRAELGRYALLLAAAAFSVQGAVPTNRRAKLLAMFPDLTQEQLQGLGRAFGQFRT